MCKVGPGGRRAGDRRAEGCSPTGRAVSSGSALLTEDT